MLPFADAAGALDGQRGKSPFFQLLNGVWEFYLAPNPTEIDPAYVQDGYVSDKWGTLPVPADRKSVV